MNQREWLDRLGEVMLPHEVASALGVSVDTLRRLDIPHVRVARGSHIYFPRDVMAWLEAHPREGSEPAPTWDDINDLVELANAKAPA